MRLLKRIVFFWGAFLTVLAFINASTIGIMELASGLILMWIAYLAFMYGASRTAQNRYNAPVSRLSEARLQLIISLAFSALAIPAIIQFYTGKTFIQVISGLLAGGSSYREYQEYFRYENLSQFSFAKVPIILLNSAAKFLLVFWTIRTFSYRENKRPLEIALAMTFPLLYVYFSIARGTSVELFELLCLFTVCLLLRIDRRKMRITRVRTIILMSIMAFIGISYFQYSLQVRGPMDCATAEICLDESTIIMRFLPSLGLVTYSLTGYFLFGIFFTSVAIQQVILATPINILTSAVPGGFLWNPSLRGGMRSVICGKLIDCGVAWIPDSMNIIYVAGLSGFLALLYFIGLQSGKMTRNAIQGASLIDAMGLYFILIFMISLPVGSLLFISSSNVACVAIIIVLKFSKPIRKSFGKMMSIRVIH